MLAPTTRYLLVCAALLAAISTIAIPQFSIAVVVLCLFAAPVVELVARKRVGLAIFLGVWIAAGMLSPPDPRWHLVGIVIGAGLALLWRWHARRARARHA